MPHFLTWRLGNRTLVFTIARQALYQLNHLPGPVHLILLTTQGLSLLHVWHLRAACGHRVKRCVPMAWVWSAEQCPGGLGEEPCGLSHLPVSHTGLASFPLLQASPCRPFPPSLRSWSKLIFELHGSDKHTSWAAQQRFILSPVRHSSFFPSASVPLIAGNSVTNLCLLKGLFQ